MADGKVFVRLRLAWRPSSPVHVGAGTGGQGFVDRAVVRWADNRPYVPGSSVKGKVLHYARAIYRAAGKPVCRWQFPQGEWEEAEGQVPGPWGCGCPLCVLFGAPGFAPGALVFTDLLPEGPGGRVVMRTSVSLDRRRRAALEGRLFSLEAVGGPGLVFTGLVQGWLPRQEIGEQVGLLYAALRLVPQFGGGRSRGLGWGEMQVTLDGGLRGQEEALREWVARWI